MNDTSAFGGYQNDPAAGSVAGQPPTLGQYKFSPDEMRVLQDCNRESFYKRSLPISTALGLGTLAAVQRGIFKPSPRFGAVPKVTAAVAVGYFLGKLSYQQACAEKLMALPGSYIGQILRDRRDGKVGGSPMQTPSAGMLGASAGDIYSDAGPGSSLDLDTDRPAFSDDAFRPDHDGSPIASLKDPVAPTQPALSYEELRRKNRGEFSDSKQDPYRVSPTPPVRPSRPPPIATNKYGDALD